MTTTDKHATIEELLEAVFMCGPCWGYIERSGCHYEGVLGQQWEEQEFGMSWPPNLEISQLEQCQSPASKDENTETEEASEL
jgi:hypothetical protein